MGSYNARSVLTDAIQILRDRGICRGVMAHPSGSVDLIGALALASGVKLKDLLSSDRVLDFIPQGRLVAFWDAIAAIEAISGANITTISDKESLEGLEKIVSIVLDEI